MNRVEYDNLHKFYASLGIILIVVPIAIALYVISKDCELLSEREFAELSSYSKGIIVLKNQWLNCFFSWFPICAALSISGGSIFLACGINQWDRTQNLLDEKLGQEVAVLKLTRSGMSAQETSQKYEAEANETTEAIREEETETKANPAPKSPPEITAVKTGTSSNNHQKQPDNTEVPKSTEQTKKHNQFSFCRTYMEIEDACVSYVKSKHKNGYNFLRNIRIGESFCDLACILKNAKTDILCEIKYWAGALPHRVLLNRVFHRLKQMSVEYKDNIQRSCQSLLINRGSRRQNTHDGREIKRIFARSSKYGRQHTNLIFIEGNITC